MAPWEELRYFALPVQGPLVTASAGGSLIIGRDPMRAVLIIAIAASATGIATVSPVQSGSGAGVTVGTNSPLNLNAHDHPGLCQSSWYSTTPTAPAVCALSVSFIRWPVEASGVPLPNQRLSDSAIRAMLGGLDAEE